MREKLTKALMSFWTWGLLISLLTVVFCVLGSGTATADSFISVTNITGVPLTATVGSELSLTGTVSPPNATNQNIIWSVKDAGTTGATISGNTLSTTGVGTVVVTATIGGDAAGAMSYTQDFIVTVQSPPPPPPTAYTVTFNSNDGSEVTSQAVYYNNTVTKPSDPTKTGYTFVGWYTDSELKNAFNFGAPITGNITLHALWSATICTVTFNSNGGSEVASQAVNYNNTATKPSDPTRLEYNFVGWYTDSGLNTPFDFGSKITGNITLYANWKYEFWQTVGSAGFSASWADSTSIAIDSSGIPYVVYVDNGNKDKATVKKYDGSSWQTVGSAGFSVGQVYYTIIAIDSSGTPYVVYRDDRYTGRLIMKKYDGSSWQTVGNAGFSSEGLPSNISIAIDSSGTPYAIYGDVENEYKATVKKYDGSSWQTVGNAGFTASVATYTSIAIDSNGTPYVVYMDYGNEYKATVKKYDGSSWQTVGSVGFSASIALYTSIAIDSSGTPYVVYMDVGNEYKATVKKYDGSSWQTVGSAGFSASMGSYTSIAIDSSGTPYVVYSDYGNEHKATVKKYTVNGRQPVAINDLNKNLTVGADGTAVVFTPDSHTEVGRDQVSITVPNGVSGTKLDLGQILQHTHTEGKNSSALPNTLISSRLNLGDTTTTPVNVLVQIPEGTTVSAPAEWNGTINTPTVLAKSSVDVPSKDSKYSKVDTVIEIGYGDVPLTFSHSIRILIPGRANNKVGYVRNGAFTPITTELSADNQSTADSTLGDGQDGYINVGSDLVIWTKHFTKFVTYTETANATTGQLQFSQSSDNVDENAGTATITVNRLNGSDGTVTVHYNTSDNTATAGEDYIATSGDLTFGTGETSKIFIIPIIKDDVQENNETINLTLTNPTGGAALGSPSTAVLTIIDPDPSDDPSVPDDSQYTLWPNLTGNLGVAVNKVWQITLRQELASSTLTTSNLFICRAGTGEKQPVDIKESYDPGTNVTTVTLTPTQPYSKGGSYELYINKSLKSKDERELAQSLRLPFTVSALAPEDTKYSLWSSTGTTERVAQDKEWQIKFNQEADASTLSDTSVFICQAGTGERHPVSIEVVNDPDSQTATVKVKPLQPYSKGGKYVLYVDCYLKSKDGANLTHGIRLPFTVNDESSDQ